MRTLVGTGSFSTAFKELPASLFFLHNSKNKNRRGKTGVEKTEGKRPAGEGMGTTILLLCYIFTSSEPYHTIIMLWYIYLPYHDNVKMHTITNSGTLINFDRRIHADLRNHIRSSWAARLEILQRLGVQPAQKIGSLGIMGINWGPA